MYNRFFGFREKPFRLVPDPAFLFLSKSHEEALAHLTYALSQGDGFVVITGEAGTGKTTLCREFLDHLDEQTTPAYIFNPKMDSVQLLKSINEDFGIDSASQNLKDLIDTLNTFLIDEKRNAKKPVVLIDEAQNLDRDVLEQLRLLSNLETSREKLIQIILLGQPELESLLDSYELRQLGQRITLSCRLSPLSEDETRAYIQHRIHRVSQRGENPFDWHTFGHIYRYSGGNPRLINRVCDRALVTAYSLGKTVIKPFIVKAAIKELRSSPASRHYMIPARNLSWGLLSCTVGFLMAVLFYQIGLLDVNALLTHEKGRATEKTAPPVRIETVTAQKKDYKETQPLLSKPEKKAPMNVMDLSDIISGREGRPSAFSAAETVLSLWTQEPIIETSLQHLDDLALFFNLIGKRNGMVIQEYRGDLEMLIKLNLPAIVEFQKPEATEPVYMALIGATVDRLILCCGASGKTISVKSDVFSKAWSEKAVIFWKDFFRISGVIPREAAPEVILSLKLLMKDLGFNGFKIDTVYDAAIEDAVKRFQQNYGLPVDGKVGPLTKIALYNQKKSLNIPRLTSENYLQVLKQETEQ